MGEAESALGVEDLARVEPKIEDDRVCRASRAKEVTRDFAEVIGDELDLDASRVADPHLSDREHRGVPFESDQSPTGGDAFDQRERMAALSHRAVDNNRARRRRQRLQDLLDHHRLVRRTEIFAWVRAAGCA